MSIRASRVPYKSLQDSETSELQVGVKQPKHCIIVGA